MIKKEPPENWWPPGRIFYSQSQIVWLIPFMDMLKLGEWPPECRESAYSGSNSNRVSHRARFELAALIYADLSCAIEKTSKDGEKLVDQVKAELPLDYDARSALRFISKSLRGVGEFKGKTNLISYNDWCFWEDVRFQIRRREREYYRLKEGIG